MIPFQTLCEEANRYSLNVNYRTTLPEAIGDFSKLVLGYLSASLKTANYNIKQVFQEEPYRIIISSRNFQEGEWVLVVSFNKEKNCFVISKGFYNRRLETVTVQQSDECAGMSAAELHREIMNRMHVVGKEKPHHLELKKPRDTTGPTQGSMRAGQKEINLSKNWQS